MHKTIFILICSLLFGMVSAEPICCEEAYNGVNGKLELAPVFVHIDVLKHGKTTHRMDLPGAKVDAYYRIWSGLVIKPSLLICKNHHDRVTTGGVGFGFCIPYKGCCFTPTAGCNFGSLKTEETIEVEAEVMAPTGQMITLTVPVKKMKEKFRSVSPYIGFEASYTFCPCWRVVVNYQYSWSRTHTTFSKDGKEKRFKDKSEGSTYSAMLEHDLNAHCSINLGGSYNSSLSKEKHGLRAYGFKLGVAYWF